MKVNPWGSRRIGVSGYSARPGVSLSNFPLLYLCIKKAFAYSI